MANDIFRLKKRYGLMFEDSITGGLDEHFKGRSDVFQSTSGTKEDLEQGTDCIIYGIPCDLTSNFSGKDFTEKLEKSVTIMPGLEVHFGIRTGNSHKGYTPFDVPVLVIGIDIESVLLGDWMNTIVGAFMAKIDEIINVGQDQYLDWLDANVA